MPRDILLEDNDLKRLLPTALTLPEIAKLLDVSENTVKRAIKRSGLEEYRLGITDGQHLLAYKRAQAGSFKIMDRIRDELSAPEVLSGMPISAKIALYKTLAITAGIAFDKQRLLEGKSTGNISVRVIYRELQEEKDKLLARIERARACEDR